MARFTLRWYRRFALYSLKRLLQKDVFASRKDGSSARKAARKGLVSELSGRSAGVRCCPLRA